MQRNAFQIVLHFDNFFFWVKNPNWVGILPSHSNQCYFLVYSFSFFRIRFISFHRNLILILHSSSNSIPILVEMNFQTEWKIISNIFNSKLKIVFFSIACPCSFHLVLHRFHDCVLTLFICRKKKFVFYFIFSNFAGQTSHIIVFYRCIVQNQNCIRNIFFSSSFFSSSCIAPFWFYYPFHLLPK